MVAAVIAAAAAAAAVAVMVRLCSRRDQGNACGRDLFGDIWHFMA